MLRILDKIGMWTIAEFDDRFLGTESLFNWIQDLEDELSGAGHVDRKFLNARIAVCEEGLKRFTTDDPLSIENRRRALAEAYFELGEIAKAEDLYREWLDVDPNWGWGWIGWSHYYQFSKTELKDPERAEQLLREGLSIAEVEDRADIADRLADLLAEQGRSDEALVFKNQARKIAAEAKSSKTVVSPAEPRQSKFSGFASKMQETSSPVVRGPKVRRNEPCPCGSGKKFKRCCGS